MTTFYICRHGQTENNKLGRLSGWIDSPLTPEGLPQTQAVAHKLQALKIDAIYSSDLGRAFTTAYTIARIRGFDDEIIRLAGLRENGYGDLAFMFVEDAEARHPRLHRDTNYTPPGGESLADMQERVLMTIIELNDQLQNRQVLLVTHDGVIKAVKAAFSGQDLGAHNINASYNHDYVASFTVNDGKIVDYSEIG